MSIVEFLIARIAEDEAVARQSSNPFADSEFDVALWDELQLAEDRYDIQPHGRMCGWKLGEGMRDDCTCIWPARVLAECEAKRQVLDDHAPYYEGSDFCGGHDDRHTVEQCALRRVMASVYADHPDFQEEWHV